jgi:catechol 2,3-dioxygenase-like lactoylglutathione lyase family enzyme
MDESFIEHKRNGYADQLLCEAHAPLMRIAAGVICAENAGMDGRFSPSAKPMAFIVTSDRARAKAFYGGILGFALASEDDFAAVFDMDGTMLRISTVAGHAPAPHTVLGWEVPDIASAVRTLASRGVKFTIYEGFGQDELGIWTAPGSGNRVAWFPDPDGNNLSLTQF